MKIITLNTWGGRAGKEPLLEFLKREAIDTDVFCLQEVWAAPYEHLEGLMAGGVPVTNDTTMVYGLREISEALTDFEPYFTPLNGDNYGLVMMVKKSWTATATGEQWVYAEKGYVNSQDVGDHARAIQYVTVQNEGQAMTIINFHGLWALGGVGKVDTAERLEQSQKIIDFIKTLTTPVVFCGDFNLNPDTESLKMLEVAGLRNLVKEYNVTSTRSSLYTKPGKFADYVFTSQGLAVTDFSVLPDEVSDHLALSVSINV